jgi:hypothetical protein
MQDVQTQRSARAYIYQIAGSEFAHRRAHVCTCLWCKAISLASPNSCVTSKRWPCARILATGTRAPEITSTLADPSDTSTALFSRAKKLGMRSAVHILQSISLCLTHMLHISLPKTFSPDSLYPLSTCWGCAATSCANSRLQTPANQCKAALRSAACSAQGHHFLSFCNRCKLSRSSAIRNASLSAWLVMGNDPCNLTPARVRNRSCGSLNPYTNKTSSVPICKMLSSAHARVRMFAWFAKACTWGERVHFCVGGAYVCRAEERLICPAHDLAHHQARIRLR